MTSTIKVNNIQNQCGANIINENSNTITLGASGDTIALASGASQTGFGRTGTVDWDTTPKTATFSAVSGDGFFCNTTSSAFTCNLPAGSAGAIVSLADYAATWDSNNLTVSPNGSDKIGGVSDNVFLNTKGQSVTFVYVDGTQGWINVQDSTSNERANEFIIATGGTITTSGNCKIHTFTGPGTFTVCSTAVCAANNVVSHLVVAGGGGAASGSGGEGGGGGGAGGYREVKAPTTPYTASPLDGYPSAPNRVTVTATAFPIAVGGGGAGGTYQNPYNNAERGVSGSASSFSTISSAGGGGGGPGHNPGTDAALTGGSGGGGGAYGNSGASGNTPPVTPAQGNNGGTGGPGNPGYAAGGGGGATANGANAPGGTAGNGGAGATTEINASPVTRAGGGGGGAHPGGTAGSGNAGGGNGNNSGAGSAGTANTGGGGGGAGDTGAGGLGGSGIVIIRYKFQ